MPPIDPLLETIAPAICVGGSTGWDLLFLFAILFAVGLEVKSAPTNLYHADVAGCGVVQHLVSCASLSYDYYTPDPDWQREWKLRNSDPINSEVVKKKWRVLKIGRFICKWRLRPPRSTTATTTRRRQGLVATGQILPASRAYG